MLPPAYYFSFYVPKFEYIILNDNFLAWLKNIRPSLTLSSGYLLFPGLDSGLFLFVCIYKMGRDMGYTRNSQGPLQK